MSTETLVPAVVVSGPPIDRFVRPSLLWYLAFDGGLATATAMAANQKVYDAVSEAAPVPVPSRKALQAFVIGSFVLHVVESKVTYGMAKRRGMDKSAVRWGTHAFIVGFPAMLKLRKVTKPVV
jgi:hypothetical protein